MLRQQREMIELTRAGKATLTVQYPVMPAAGTFGFDGTPYDRLIDCTKLGAIITNPVTWKSRRVARGMRVVPLPSGVLVHTGLPNPGISRVIKQYRARWQRSPVPMIVHVVATAAADVARCAQALDGVEGVAGIEIGIHDQADDHELGDMIRAVRDNTFLPFLVRLPLYTAPDLALVAQDEGAGGLVIAAPPRGTARDPESGQLVGGRIYGPMQAAQALRAVGQVARLVSIPVIGCGGIHNPDDARNFIDAGAVAVQVDTVTWTQPHMTEIIARNLGGLELTRAAGALADEWEPGMGRTLWLERLGAAPDDMGPPLPPPVLPT